MGEDDQGVSRVLCLKRAVPANRQATRSHSQAEQQPAPALIKPQVIGQASAVLIAGNPQRLLGGLL